MTSASISIMWMTPINIQADGLPMVPETAPDDMDSKYPLANLWNKIISSRTLQLDNEFPDLFAELQVSVASGQIAISTPIIPTNKECVISRIPDLHLTIFPRLIWTFGHPIHVSSPLPIRIPAPLYIHICTSTSRSLYLRTSDLHTSAASLHHSSFVLSP
ncbi:uncharacterized protein HD556DRAFT_1451062 [Suillus plorans]|uniref:Uncharacterized protein n=1 Tax=Suillus plorans TaxID=116603 RepID=A0A9P7AAH2_9AGAM|nr:uncharacterized protein HD556DRAFT_1451062 [Suillus plorans]KAG1785098.1 hypothetical protein HD556DRAFT_1451062 [Suillus plorans]